MHLLLNPHHLLVTLTITGMIMFGQMGWCYPRWQ
ncbi:unnamed protein product [Brassica rapa subsp. narinosa]|uniref:(rape) hypothetical protein n=1 Tax=Brassica napus TaxID=3708 RepID=A0A816W3R9_BRANA|nr:unnamed protein product [Brassica napus]